MRSEQEMLDLILGVAQSDGRVRAVGLNGSRANPNAPRDIFQDFDIVYLVTDVDSFKRTPDWIDVFGERVILQLPDDSALFPGGRDGCWAYLMQFQDGNRMDLTLRPASQARDYAREDCETVVLLDKDGILPALPPASDDWYHVRRPSRAEYDACCNEFWWVTPYVAKGLWRGELLFALYHLNVCVRDMLEKMLEWKAGVLTDFGVSTGKCQKYLQRYLPAEDWAALARTFPHGEEEDAWRALGEMGRLFGTAARFVGDALGYAYPREDERRVVDYVDRVRRLPRGARDFGAR